MIIRCLPSMESSVRRLWGPINRAFLNEINAADALKQSEIDCNKILQSANS